MKNPAKVDFKQKETPMTGNSTKKNAAAVGFKQPQMAAGKTSASKNKSELGFKQKTAANTGTSTKKNPAKVGFTQPNPAKKTTKMPMASGGKVNTSPSGTKAVSGQKIAPKITSTDDIVAYRKEKYGA